MREVVNESVTGHILHILIFINRFFLSLLAVRSLAVASRARQF